MLLRRAGLLALVLLGAAPAWAAEAERIDTASQHHEWARKFAPTDPASGPSRGGPLADRPAGLAEGACERAELVFGRVPLQQWRFSSCT